MKDRRMFHINSKAINSKNSQILIQIGAHNMYNKRIK